MTHDAAFLADIIERPDDDVPRLVFADWLEDHGQPDRAAFIRVQIELSREGLPDGRRQELEATEKQLLKEHGEEWLGHMRPWLSAWEYRRGFVHRVSLKAATLLKHADTLFRLAPIRHAEVHKAEKLGRDLAGCPHLARLTSLRVHGLHTQDSVSLVASPHLGGLTSLSLPEAALTDAGVGALAVSPLLARLTTLDLTCNGISDEGIRALAQSPNASGLEQLDLSRNLVGESGAAALAGSRHLAGLRSLRLCHLWRGERGEALLRERFAYRVHIG